VPASQLAGATQDKIDELISDALKAAFVKTHNEIVSEERAIECGTTALVAYVFRQRIYVANVGDSRAVIAYRDGRFERITRDHKSNDEIEMAAVQKRGGFVARGRVMGMIAIARALGDKSLSEYLGHSPDVFVRPLDDADYLILACDGVWDVLTDAEAVRIARSTRDPAKIAVRLRDTAIDRNSKDNISCLVIQLNSANVPKPVGDDDDDDEAAAATGAGGAADSGDEGDGEDDDTEETDATPAAAPAPVTRQREAGSSRAPPPPMFTN
jgi:serine/threonine protein phosphatase PrpC